MPPDIAELTHISRVPVFEIDCFQIYILLHYGKIFQHTERVCGIL